MPKDQLQIWEIPNPLEAYPSHEQFPYNAAGKTVNGVVEQELINSTEPFLITGYASLTKIVYFLAKCRARKDPLQKVRILLGHEPYPMQSSQTNSLRPRPHLSQEIVDYWLNRGISLYQTLVILEAIEFVRLGQVESRISLEGQILHAKMYLSDQSVTMGSSNFSRAGMSEQKEANIRLTPENPELLAGARTLAECFWQESQPYDLVQLLEQLLKNVTWQEALGRGCAILLEGEWAERYLAQQGVTEGGPLWPSQVKGIAQALWILDNVGSVLVADATGSGKTRLGVSLLAATLNRIWSSGRRRHDMPLMVCPPNVQDNWEKEASRRGVILKTLSHGVLSNKHTEKQETFMIDLRRAQILAIDEVQNHFNITSRRTNLVLSNTSDHRILFTATPVNRGPQDIVAVINLLGADNFDEKVLELLKPLWNDPVVDLPKETINLLRQQIQRFTVRRTKTMLNQMVDQEPDRYHNAQGKLCRYPQHFSSTYSCNESPQDIELVLQIGNLASQLKGLLNLRKPIELPSNWEQMRSTLSQAEQEEKYLSQRLSAAAALTKYLILSSLRSSRAALLEHLKGSQEAAQQFKLSLPKGHDGGNIMHRLQEQSGQPPGAKLSIPLPDWLMDPMAHAQATTKELALYEEILQRFLQMSDNREQAKAKIIQEMLQRHDLLIAFDHHPITLLDIASRLHGLDITEVLVATGSNSPQKKQVNQKFGLLSEAKGIVALCSDAMSEGLNLQRASGMVLLDMPTVMRVAEQRIGRIDRMDSPHDQIEVLWPKDAPEFTLRIDERFFGRHELVSTLIGSNTPLPEGLDWRQGEKITPDEPGDFIKELENEEDWQEMRDAFEPVRALVWGEQALVGSEIYEQLRKSTAKVFSSVSAVYAEQPWAYFAIEGYGGRAPFWVFLDSFKALPMTDLWKIDEALRSHLSGEVIPRPLDANFAAALEKFLLRLAQSEALLLPKRKQRALHEMKFILEKYAKAAEVEKDKSRQRVIESLLRLRDGSRREEEAVVDLHALAERWLDLIHPWWYKSLKEFRRSRPMVLKDVRPLLLSNPIPTEELEQAFSNCPQVKPLDQRIVAAVVGLK